jgi:hypothetical protein
VIASGESPVAGAQAVPDALAAGAGVDEAGEGGLAGAGLAVNADAKATVSGLGQSRDALGEDRVLEDQCGGRRLRGAVIGDRPGGHGDRPGGQGETGAV